ncbi:type II toxin-antitoxin system VapC family toxin [Promicromonospora sp. NPDC060271]|uniref:type II toxin-antitoxin system VapC family toxin n=1 Tax=Promicromonospora sp. NPDC060271 TaxID=3347089 RepID=UPI0036526123
MLAFFDTHLLIWALLDDQERLPQGARDLLVDPSTEPLFSPASIWEVAIKSSLGRVDFTLDPHLMRKHLLDSGYGEMPIDGAHTAAVAGLPPIHNDPFDRLLVAQATHEGILLVTHDETVSRYPGPVRLV